MTTAIEPVGPNETPVEAAPPPKKRRRGWLIALIVVAVLALLGVIGFFVGESFAKDYARDYARARIIEVLNLSDDAQVDVDLGRGSIILQALAGRIDTVDVDVPDVVFGNLTGDVTFHAEGVPLDQTAPVDVLRIDFAIGPDDLAALGASEGDVDAPSFVFQNGEISLSSEVAVFGLAIPLGFTFEPSAAEGDLVLTPTSLTIGTQTFTADTADDSFFGQIARAFLQPQSLCIAASVPRALTLVDVTIEGEELLLRFDADGSTLGGPEFATRGVCPA